MSIGLLMKSNGFQQANFSDSNLPLFYVHIFVLALSSPFFINIVVT